MHLKRIFNTPAGASPEGTASEGRMDQSDFPDFFAAAPTITLSDPLAAFLGVSKSGVIHYCYADVVKLAGHSCPTVAGAFLMVRRGLLALYGAELPRRGDIEVHLRDPGDQGTTGVIATVAMLLTGAAPETGFGGIGPGARFRRRNLLHFDAPIDGLMALRRTDNGRGVILDLDPGATPADPAMRALFPRVLGTRPDQADLDRFGQLWQERVERMLTGHADDPALVRVLEWRAAA